MANRDFQLSTKNNAKIRLPDNFIAPGSVYSHFEVEISGYKGIVRFTRELETSDRFYTFKLCQDRQNENYMSVDLSLTDRKDRVIFTVEYLKLLFTGDTGVEEVTYTLRHIYPGPMDELMMLWARTNNVSSVFLGLLDLSSGMLKAQFRHTNKQIAIPLYEPPRSPISRIMPIPYSTPSMSGNRPDQRSTSRNMPVQGQKVPPSSSSSIEWLISPSTPSTSGIMPIRRSASEDMSVKPSTSENIPVQPFTLENMLVQGQKVPSSNSPEFCPRASAGNGPPPSRNTKELKCFEEFKSLPTPVEADVNLSSLNNLQLTGAAPTLLVATKKFSSDSQNNQDVRSTEFGEPEESEEPDSEFIDDELNLGGFTSAEVETILSSAWALLHSDNNTSVDSGTVRPPERDAEQNLLAAQSQETADSTPYEPSTVEDELTDDALNEILAAEPIVDIMDVETRGHHVLDDITDVLRDDLPDLFEPALDTNEEEGAQFSWLPLPQPATTSSPPDRTAPPAGAGP